MIDKSPQSTFRACADNGTVSSRIACTGNVRVEFLRCEAEATVRWSVARAEVSLVWLRDKGSNARITVAGRGSDCIAPGRAHFWFFPEGFGAEGELTGKGAYDCAGVSVDPSFLPPAARQSLGEPIAGFSCHSLRRSFSELAEELTESDEVLPLFTEGWVMRVLAHVARASSKCQVWRSLSGSHFARAFKASTGVPPHQWVMAERIGSSRVGSDMLTARECDVLAMISQGFCNKRVGRALEISPETVKSHVKNIFSKLAVNTRIEAVSRAGSLGLL